ncbi:MAG: carbohydrate-binding domain-containing protein [Desulfitobacterium sp.]|nr:carbohydrate-binding domain-containing protein [Desulfitobacterium sp.]
MIGKWTVGVVFTAIALVFALATAGCGNKEETLEVLNDPVAISSGPAASHAVYDLSFTEEDLDSSYDIDAATYIVLKEDNIEVTGEGAVAADKTLTISEGGTYLLKGELSNGQVIVEAPESEKVQLILHGVSIRNDIQPSLLIKEGGKVITTLAADQMNYLTVGDNNSGDDEQDLDSVIYSQGDLTINGTGTLKVRSSNYGIVSQGELRVTGGKLSITSLGEGLFAKNAIKIKDGNFRLDTQKDSFRAENGEDESKGFIYIAGGNFDIHSQGNGFHAETLLQIDAGNFNITTEESNRAPNGLTNIALIAHKEIILNEGLYDLNTSDDGISSNGRLVITGGTIGINSETKGLHAHGDLTITGGILYIEKSHVGISGENIVITGGIVEVNTDDDGFIVAGGKDSTDSTSEKNNFLRVSGGEIHIISNGDGLDINGDLFIDGGKLLLSSPVSSGKATFGFGGKAIITGGIIMATGSSVTAQSFSDSSTQYSVLHNLTDIMNAGSEITILDSNGKEILKWTADQDFCSVQFSSPDLLEGKTYTLVADNFSDKIVLNSITTSNEAAFSTAISGAKRENPPMEINKFSRNN